MSAQRKYYLFTCVVMLIGAVLAVVGGDYTALVVFLVIGATFFWIQSRVDRFTEQRQRRDDGA